MKQNFIYTFILTTGVLLSGMVTITACAQDQWEPPMPKMLSSGGMVSIERGQNLFSEHCVNCHGIRGDGTGIRRYSWIPEQFVPDLTDADYLEGRDDDILVNLHDGLRNQDPPAVIMPSFRYILSEEDMQSVLAYVKTLTKRTALESGKQFCLVTYLPPGDINMAKAVREMASNHHAALLANHGPVVSAQEQVGMAETILIVDDNEVHMRLFDDLLRVHGYGTVKSVNGMDVNSERI